MRITHSYRIPLRPLAQPNRARVVCNPPRVRASSMWENSDLKPEFPSWLMRFATSAAHRIPFADASPAAILREAPVVPTGEAERLRLVQQVFLTEGMDPPAEAGLKEGLWRVIPGGLETLCWATLQGHEDYVALTARLQDTPRQSAQLTENFSQWAKRRQWLALAYTHLFMPFLYGESLDLSRPESVTKYIPFRELELKKLTALEKILLTRCLRLAVVEQDCSIGEYIFSASFLSRVCRHGLPKGLKLNDFLSQAILSERAFPDCMALSLPPKLQGSNHMEWAGEMRDREVPFVRSAHLLYDVGVCAHWTSFFFRFFPTQAEFIERTREAFRDGDSLMPKQKRKEREHFFALGQLVEAKPFYALIEKVQRELATFIMRRDDSWTLAVGNLEDIAPFAPPLLAPRRIRGKGEEKPAYSRDFMIFNLSTAEGGILASHHASTDDGVEKAFYAHAIDPFRSSFRLPAKDCVFPFPEKRVLSEEEALAYSVAFQRETLVEYARREADWQGHEQFDCAFGELVLPFRRGGALHREITECLRSTESEKRQRGLEIYLLWANDAAHHPLAFFPLVSVRDEGSERVALDLQRFERTLDLLNHLFGGEGSELFEPKKKQIVKEEPFKRKSPAERVAEMKDQLARLREQGACSDMIRFQKERLQRAIAEARGEKKKKKVVAERERQIDTHDFTLLPERLWDPSQSDKDMFEGIVALTGYYIADILEAAKKTFSDPQDRYDLFSCNLYRLHPQALRRDFAEKFTEISGRDSPLEVEQLSGLAKELYGGELMDAFFLQALKTEAIRAGWMVVNQEGKMFPTPQGLEVAGRRTPLSLAQQVLAQQSFLGFQTWDQNGSLTESLERSAYWHHPWQRGVLIVTAAENRITLSPYVSVELKPEAGLGNHFALLCDGGYARLFPLHWLSERQEAIAESESLTVPLPIEVLRGERAIKNDEMPKRETPQAKIHLPEVKGGLILEVEEGPNSETYGFLNEIRGEVQAHFGANPFGRVYILRLGEAKADQAAPVVIEAPFMTLNRTSFSTKWGAGSKRRVEFVTRLSSACPMKDSGAAGTPSSGAVAGPDELLRAIDYNLGQRNSAPEILVALLQALPEGLKGEGEYELRKAQERIETVRRRNEVIAAIVSEIQGRASSIAQAIQDDNQIAPEERKRLARLGLKPHEITDAVLQAIKGEVGRCYCGSSATVLPPSELIVHKKQGWVPKVGIFAFRGPLSHLRHIGPGRFIEGVTEKDDSSAAGKQVIGVYCNGHVLAFDPETGQVLPQTVVTFYQAVRSFEQREEVEISTLLEGLEPEEGQRRLKVLETLLHSGQGVLYRYLAGMFPKAGHKYPGKLKNALLHAWVYYCAPEWIAKEVGMEQRQWPLSRLEHDFDLLVRSLTEGHPIERAAEYLHLVFLPFLSSPKTQATRNRVKRAEEWSHHVLDTLARYESRAQDLLLGNPIRGRVIEMTEKCEVYFPGLDEAVVPGAIAYFNRFIGGELVLEETQWPILIVKEKSPDQALSEMPPEPEDGLKEADISLIARASSALTFFGERVIRDFRASVSELMEDAKGNQDPVYGQSLRNMLRTLCRTVALMDPALEDPDLFVEAEKIPPTGSMRQYGDERFSFYAPISGSGQRGRIHVVARPRYYEDNFGRHARAFRVNTFLPNSMLTLEQRRELGVTHNVSFRLEASRERPDRGFHFNFEGVVRRREKPLDPKNFHVYLRYLDASSFAQGVERFSWETARRVRRVRSWQRAQEDYPTAV